MNVTKIELCSRVSKKFKMPAGELKPIFDSFLEEILTVIAEGQNIELRGFGSFKKTFRRARTGRNPRTGERVNIPAATFPKFKFSKEAQRIFEQKANDIESSRDSMFKRRKRRPPKKESVSKVA